MDSPLPKYAAVALSITSAAAGVWARFIVVEERQANQHAVIVELTAELAKLRAKVDAEERATRERFHASDLRMSLVEQRDSVTVVRRRR